MKRTTQDKTGQYETKCRGNHILNFNEFAQKLYTRCGNGETQPNFLRELFFKISSEHDDSIFKADDDYLRKIFSGKRKLPQKSASYLLTHLDKSKFDTYIYDLLAEDALVELCNDFESIVGNSSAEDISTKIADLFKSILERIVAKKEISVNKTTTLELSSFALERELSEIVKDLASLRPEQRKINLSYEPYKVDNKILPGNFSLISEIKKDVVENYVYIEDLFKNASLKNTTFFDQLASEVKYACDNMISQPHSQEAVFYEMVKWLKNKVSHKSDIACRKIISFFVQNCEVFHAFTE